MVVLLRRGMDDATLPLAAPPYLTALGRRRAIVPSMSIIEAEFENGVLRPSSPLRLRPGERVGIVLVRRPDALRWDVERLAKTPSAEEKALTEEGLGEWGAAIDREDGR